MPRRIMGIGGANRPNAPGALRAWKFRRDA